MFSLSRRQDIVVTVLRGKDTPFQVIQNPDGSEQVINHFKMNIKNQTFDDLSIKMALPEELVEKHVEIVTQSDKLDIGAGKNLTVHFFIKFPRGLTDRMDSESVKINFLDPASGEIKTTEDLHLIGPGAI
jgi:hypothetical protein